jgi:hypothetical protein
MRMLNTKILQLNSIELLHMKKKKNGSSCDGPFFIYIPFEKCNLHLIRLIILGADKTNFTTILGI